MSDSTVTEPAKTPPPEPERDAEEPPPNRWAAYLPTVKTTVAAVFLALVIGAILIAFSTPRVIESL
jgi:hypothetical protein